MVKKTSAPAKPVARKSAAATSARKAAPRAKALHAVAAGGVEATAAAAQVDERIDETAARNTLAINPLIGIRARDIGGAAQALLGAAVKQPAKAARHLGAYARELGKAAMGSSETELDPKDKRFADPALQSNGCSSACDRPMPPPARNSTATSTPFVQAVIDDLGGGQPSPPKGHLVVFSGYTVDRTGPQAPAVPRFPGSVQQQAGAAIREALERLKGERQPLTVLASAAPGADILALEACKALGIETWLCLPLERDAVAGEVFQHYDDDWRKRFFALADAQPGDRTFVMSHTGRLPDWLGASGMTPWSLGNCWMLLQAQAWGAQSVTLLAFCDDSAVDRSDAGTAEIVRQARKAGNYDVRVIDSKHPPPPEVRGCRRRRETEVGHTRYCHCGTRRTHRLNSCFVCGVHDVDRQRRGTELRAARCCDGSGLDSRPAQRAAGKLDTIGLRSAPSVCRPSRSSRTW